MNNKGFISIALVILGVVLAGALAYVTLGKKSPTDQSQINSSQNIQQTVTTTPVDQNNQISSQTNNSNGAEETYRGNLFEFNYPSILSVTPKGESISISHSVSYRHPDPCDFKGDAAQPLDKITDFTVSLKLFNSGLKDTVKANETDYLANNFFQDTTVKTSPGFIDEFNAGNLHGHQVTSGSEGCGRYTYYFPLSTTKTLFVSRGFIPEFNPINADYQTYLNVPGVISPTQEENYFKTILSSFTTTSVTSNNTSEKQWQEVISSHGGFSFRVPQEFGFSEISPSDLKNGIDVQISIGDRYYRSIGVVGNNTTNWTISAGFSGQGCSIQNYSPRGGLTTSTQTVSLDGKAFYKVGSFDDGMGSYSEDIRYVEQLTPNTCRFIEFSNTNVSVGNLTGLPGEKELIKGQGEINKNINELIPEILSTIHIIE